RSPPRGAQRDRREGDDGHAHLHPRRRSGRHDAHLRPLARAPPRARGPEPAARDPRLGAAPLGGSDGVQPHAPGQGDLSGELLLRAARARGGRGRMKPSVAWNVILLGVALVLGACSPSGPQVGSQTNWLRACDSTDECGGLECICGVCTLPCAELACGELPDSACVASTETGAIAVCGGSAPPSGLCLPRCDEESCPAGTSCLAGVCAPTGTPSARVTLDLSARHQTLVGLGASLAYSDDVIADHAQREALYDLVFRDGGFDALRFRNRYETDDDDLSATAEIIEAATERLGRRPFLFMSSATPPAALKANASRVCEGGDAACTLSTVDDGGFDYAGFANYWRSAFEAYAALGIVPDYFSIQNHPHLVDAEEHRGEACRFLPEEGTASVTIDGEPTDVDCPGYREALEAVTSSIADLEEVPRAAV